MTAPVLTTKLDREGADSELFDRGAKPSEVKRMPIVRGRSGAWG
ncbi:hypothetical protein [Qipengyuania sp. MTN3-11]